MSKQLSLAAEERVVVGKKLGSLRRQGLVPANVYGLGQPSIALQVSAASLQKLLGRGGNNVISLQVGSQPAIQALIKQVQRRATTDQTTHVDFCRVAVSEKLKTRVPLQFVNEAKTTIAGNVTMLRSLSEVMVECLPADLPDSIEVDLSTLSEPGAVIRVGDLVVSDAVTILTDQNDMVAGLHQSRGDRSAEAEEGGEAAAGTVAPAE